MPQGHCCHGTDDGSEPLPKFEALPESSALLAGAMTPDAMAIGDSIFNGVRSATIHGELARWSPPAQVARDRQWSMVLPDYRRPILFDLEAELRDGLDLGRLREHVLQNVDRWLEERGEWSGHTFFDNIAVAGAAYGDLHDATAGQARARVPMLVAKLRHNEALDFESLASLWFSLNTAFILNPSGHPELDDLTPLEQVASRKPKRLFVNIGSNEGLFRIGITAEYSRRNREQIQKIPGLSKKLAEVLRDQCPDVERIYFNLLIRPRTLANLAPRTDADMFQTPGEGYFDQYVGRLASLNGMTGAQMRQFDEEIAAVNEKTRKSMTKVLGDRITFIDAYDLSTGLDGKHFGNAQKVVVDAGGRNFRLSNMPFSANIFGFRQGGLFGLDNMHPSIVGYAMASQAMAEAVIGAEGGDPCSIEPQTAFDADTLLQDPPRSWDSLNLLFSLIADLGILRLG
jgi:hypothetical protein